MKLGAIRLTQRFFDAPKLQPGAVDSCRAYVRATLSSFSRDVRRHGFEVAVGSSGTIGAVCSMAVARRGEAPPRTWNNFLLGAEDGVPVAVHMDFLQRPPRRVLTVVGESGRAHWDYHANELTVTTASGTAERFGGGGLDRNAMFVDAMADFLRAVRAGDAPRTTLADGIADLCVVDAIRASLVSGGAVEIRYDATMMTGVA